MDVIALAEAGFPQTVAPLGTALTEDQVAAALAHGARAGAVLRRRRRRPPRRLPRGRDRAAAPEARLQRAVRLPARRPRPRRPDPPARRRGLPGRCSTASCAPVRRADQREERQGEPAVTPEQRASLEARLKALVARIADRGVRDQYESELRADRCGPRTASWRARLAGSMAGATRRFAGKRRDNTQLDWRVPARASERSRLRQPAARRRLRLARRAQQRAGRAHAAAAGPRGAADRAPSSTIPGCWRPSARRSPSSR